MLERIFVENSSFADIVIKKREEGKVEVEVEAEKEEEEEEKRAKKKGEKYWRYSVILLRGIRDRV